MSSISVAKEPDYKAIVLKQRKKSLEYYHKKKNPEFLSKRNNKQREFYNDQKDYYKIYNKYRRAKQIDKLDEFKENNPLDYNYLINSGRVRALKGLPLVEVLVLSEAPLGDETQSSLESTEDV